MSEYLPPCFTNRCPNWQEVGELHKQLCKSMAELLIQAGGTEVLEVTACPFGAISKVGASMEDEPVLGALADELGIVGYSEDGFLD